MNDRPQTVAGVGVAVRSTDGLVLVARRVAEQGRPLALPGGKVEPGESVEECAVRELAEETGLVVELAAVRTFATVTVGEAEVIGVEAPLSQPASEATPRELEPDKVGEFAWIAPGDRPPGLYPASAALLDRLPAR